MLSARNQFEGTVREINMGRVVAEVVVAVNGIEVVSIITARSAARLQVGDQVKVIIKSTDVMIDK